MQFLVNKETVISPEHLTELLLQKAISVEKDDMLSVTSAFLEKLEYSGQLSTSSIRDIAALSMLMGYFYKVFHVQNNVEIMNDDSTSGKTTDNEGDSGANP